MNGDEELFETKYLLSVVPVYSYCKFSVVGFLRQGLETFNIFVPS